MRKFWFYSLMVGLLLAIALSGCSSGGKSGGNNGLKTADPYPSQSVDTTEYWGSNLTFQAPNNETEYNTFLNYLADITGISDANNWPESALNAVSYLLWANTYGGHLLVSPREFTTVNDVLFFEYTNWYQPNCTLSVTLSSINETAVTDSITVSIGLSLGYDMVGGFNASISKESSKTVTTAKGIEVATTYDLTQYDQSKQYKVVLTGNYAYVRYHFRVQGAKAALRPEWNTDGNGYIGYLEGIKVYQENLAVKLVHN